MDKTNWKTGVGIAVVGLVVVVGLGMLAWRGMQLVSPDGARIWALAVTVLLPVALVAGRQLGLTEARGRLQGIDDGIDKLARAADLAINARATHIVKIKEAKAQSPSVVVLPPPESVFTMRRQLPASNVVELE